MSSLRTSAGAHVRKCAAPGSGATLVGYRPVRSCRDKTDDPNAHSPTATDARGRVLRSVHALHGGPAHIGTGPATLPRRSARAGGVWQGVGTPGSRQGGP